MNLSCIIIDDEPNAVNLLEILIGQNTKWQLLAKCYDALEAMQKIETYFTFHAANHNTLPSGSNEYFFVKSGKVLRKILLEEIQYFEGEKEYVRLVTPAEQLLIYRRLKDIEEQLNPPFVRVHNSYIVNTKQIVKIQDNHIYIAGKQIPISEKFKDGFMAVINQRIF